MARSCLAVFLSGCWTTPTQPPRPPPPATLSAPPRHLSHFEHRVSLTWDLPATEVLEKRRVDIAVLDAKCVAGDSASCDAAFDRGDFGPPLDSTLARCKAGDMEMCLRVDAIDGLDSIYHSCDTATGCNRTELEEGCDRGVVSRCAAYAREEPRMIPRALALTLPGCRAGQVDACLQLDRDELAANIAREDLARATSTTCQLIGYGCERAVAVYFDAGDLDEARYYAEVRCQAFDECALALYTYSVLGVPPPYPNRIADLQAHVCDDHRCEIPAGAFGMVPDLVTLPRANRK